MKKLFNFGENLGEIAQKVTDTTKLFSKHFPPILDITPHLFRPIFPHKNPSPSYYHIIMSRKRQIGRKCGSHCRKTDEIIGDIVATIRVETSVLVFFAIISKTVNNSMLQPMHFRKDLKKIFPKMYGL